MVLCIHPKQIVFRITNGKDDKQVTSEKIQWWHVSDWCKLSSLPTAARLTAGIGNEGMDEEGSQSRCRTHGGSEEEEDEEEKEKKKNKFPRVL